LRGKVFGCRLSADVELINRGEVIRADVIAITPHGLETGQNRGLQVPVTVMGRDLLFESLHSRSDAHVGWSPLRVARIVGGFTYLIANGPEEQGRERPYAFSKCLAVLLTAQAKGSLPAMPSWRTATLRPVRMPQRSSRRAGQVVPSRPPSFEV